MSFLQGTLLGYFRKGGPVMWPLLFMAILTVAYIIERWWFYSKAKVRTDEFLGKLRAALLKKKSAEEAVKVCEQYRGPIANILKAGLLKYGTSEDEITKAMEIASTHELARLERGTAVLATSANVSPILGFLGTVTGMIKSFGVLASAGLTNPAKVAEGISEALITTATGLAIAVPALLFYNWFMTTVSRFILEMETGSTVLLETFAEMKK